ncbi:RNA polymerase factor sigma-54 [Listeria grayi FSL F6-1183]|uniref:RNA polymerase factor sigma-54 n=1 Tax=Listeria grayi FSL F6-1183 TaxID=1265827 RepID=A0A829R6K8_LISGR|nr:RNA polymerase factor sigma-54 [Listeria grayi FSL F6-1183]
MRLESGFAQKQQQSQSLKLNMTQQLTQSIAMLQFATPELTSFLEEKALENPLIEVVPGTEPAADIPYKTSSRNRADNNDWLEQIADNTQSLGDVLKEQLQMLKLPQSQRIIVLFLIESLDEAGYLTQDTDLIAAQLLMSEEAILAGLEILQNMEPAGIGARNMQECILLQIERSAKAPYIAYDLIQDYFMEFADKKWKKITAEMDVSLTEIQEVADFIQTLSRDREWHSLRKPSNISYRN